jgi:peptidyl-prolyl cis-trans isomerase SurA
MFKNVVLICTLSLGMGIAEGKQLLDKVVAVVNNNVITESELNEQVILSKKQITAQNMQVPEEKILRKQVLQHLIDVDLQLQMARQYGITVDSTEINDAIERVATMNHMTTTQLREEITRQGMTWKGYRDNIQKEMMIVRLQQKSVGKDVMVTNEQVTQYLKTVKPVNEAEKTYHLQNIVIPLSEEPTSDEVKKAKEYITTLQEKIKQGEDFSRLALEVSRGEMALEGGDLGDRHLAELPEVFAHEVVKMNVGQVSGPLRTGNGYQLIKLVATHGESMQHAVSLTHVRHILLKPDANMLPDEAKKQVHNIYQQIKSGKDFASMAKQYSLDVASAVKGGDLGWVSPGELVPEFEKAMEHLPLNQVSGPVKSKYGWHLIEVLGRKQKDDSVAFKKQQVRQFLQQRKFSELVENWQQHMRTQAYIKIADKELA